MWTKLIHFHIKCTLHSWNKPNVAKYYLWYVLVDLTCWDFREDFTSQFLKNMGQGFSLFWIFFYSILASGLGWPQKMSWEVFFTPLFFCNGFCKIGVTSPTHHHQFILRGFVTLLILFSTIYHTYFLMIVNAFPIKAPPHHCGTSSNSLVLACDINVTTPVLSTCKKSVSFKAF